MLGLELRPELPSTAKKIESKFFNTEASELFKVKKHQVKMMKKRGYNTTNEDFIFNLKIEDFIREYQSRAQKNNFSFKTALQNLYSKPIDPSNPSMVTDQIYIFFPETPKENKKKKVGSEQIKSIIKIMADHQLNHVMIITETPFTPDANKAFEELPLYRMEHYLYSELVFDPNDHFLVPKHRLMGEEEAKEYLKRNNIPSTQLPKISYQDSISRYFGATAGQIFEIKRVALSPDAPVSEYLAHRLVIHDDLEISKPTSKKKK